MLIARFSGPEQPLYVMKERTVLLIILYTRITAVSLESAEVLAETPLREGLRWLSGRYFVDATDLWFVSWDGAQARWDKAQSHSSRRPKDLLVVFERAGVGPWALLRDGCIVSPVGAEVMRLTPKPDSASLNGQGTEIVMLHGRSAAVRILETKTLETRRYAKPPEGGGVEIAPPSRPG